MADRPKAAPAVPVVVPVPEEPRVVAGWVPEEPAGLSAQCGPAVRAQPSGLRGKGRVGAGPGKQDRAGR